jgi:hypothetical protein
LFTVGTITLASNYSVGIILINYLTKFYQIFFSENYFLRQQTKLSWSINRGPGRSRSSTDQMFYICQIHWKLSMLASDGTIQT